MVLRVFPEGCRLECKEVDHGDDTSALCRSKPIPCSAITQCSFEKAPRNVSPVHVDCVSDLLLMLLWSAERPDTVLFVSEVFSPDDLSPILEPLRNWSIARPLFPCRQGLQAPVLKPDAFCPVELSVCV